MTDSPAISVVIPSFNRRDMMQDVVLPALAAQTMTDFEIIVIDNGSTDGTSEVLADRPDLRLHREEVSHGPANARNIGMDLAHAPLVAFLDSDVALAPDWLERGLAAMDADPKLGAWGGKVLYANDPDTLNAFGGALSKLGLAWDLEEGTASAEVTEPREVLWMNCSAALMRKEALEATGGFDTRYFYAFEDSDVGWRLALTGWRQVMDPDATLLHHVGDEIAPSSDGIAFHVTKNRLASLIANAGLHMLALYAPLLVAYSLTDAALRTNKLAKLKGLWWNLTHLPGTLKRRRMVQSQRQTPDSALPFAPTLFPATRLDGLRRRPGRAQRVVADTQDDRV